MNTNLYPLLFRPTLKTVVWGGQKLLQYKGLDSSTYDKGPYGESWEVSAVSGSESVVANGAFATMKLTELINRFPQDVLGKKTIEKYGPIFPLLVKFIDAGKDLSIQVHPNDEMAMREHGKMGKSEMWYVIDAKPGSYLYAGFREQITPDEYKKRIEDGTITSVLSKHEVHTGDVFYLPAGRIHAICGGILLAEIQQSSDVTYRIFDYNRLGLDGKPRELHTKLAAQALDFKVEDEYRTRYSSQENAAKCIISTPFFSCRLLTLLNQSSNSAVVINNSFHRDLIKYDSFVISTCIEGKCRITSRINGSCIELTSGNSCLIPAILADYDVIPLTPQCKLLDSFIDNQELSIANQINRFLHYLK